MTVYDYSILSLEVDSEFDANKVRLGYESGGHNGLRLRVPSPYELNDVGFLQNLSGLEYIDVSGNVVDDSAAFKVVDVREVRLMTRSRVPIPRSSQPNLRSLAFDDRPGDLGLSYRPGLRKLVLWNFSRTDLGFLSHTQGLASFSAEGLLQTISLQGLNTCPLLRTLELVNLRVESLGPISELSELRTFRLIGGPGSQRTEQYVLDLAALSGLESLEELRITFAGSVVSLHSLGRLAGLKDLRLRGTRILDNDSSSLLLDFSRRMRVVRPEE